MAKLVYQSGKLLPQRTDYLGPYQYEQDSLRFFPHAEGRVLRFANTTSGAVRYEREFTFKDHLGNLRLAYRLGQVRTLTATLEQDAATHGRESQQFDSLSVSPPTAVPTGLARTGTHAARLNAGGSAPRPLGPLTQFAVQQGDTVRATAFGLYPQATSSNSFASSLAGFIASLLQPAPTAPAGVDGSRRGGLPLLQVGLSSATLLALNQLPDGVPKGYLRVLSFTEDSVLVDQRTVQLSADALNNYETLSTGQLIVQQNGYVSVYVGNESAADVYFDDITIEHRQGLQVQENQYDPFGLDLAGVSGAAPGLRGKNFYQFNGKENQLDLGLNWNHQDWRFFDYQIGRWHVVDPEIENGQELWTPYQFGFDNAVRFSDADGRYPGEGDGFGSGFAQGFVGTFTGLRDAAVAAVQSPQAFASAALNIAQSATPTGMVAGNVQLVAGFGQAAVQAVQGNTTALGRQLGGVAGQLAIAVVTEGAGRALGAARGLARGARAVEGAEGARVPRCGCFTAGTGVSTRLGRKPIEQIQVGDSVWAYNERTHQTALRPVTQLFRYERDTVYVLHTATGEALRTTSDHPFYVRGQWVRVKRLRVGDSLVSQSGQRHVLRRIELKPEHVTVYNFTVDELHTYFVGQNAILVHNVSCPPAGGSSGPHHSGTEKPWTEGATPNSTYTHIKNGKAIQNAIYDADGKVVGHVDFKPHGHLSGHGHKFPVPGNPASGHKPGLQYHIPNEQLPPHWSNLPTGVAPHTPIGQP